MNTIDTIYEFIKKDNSINTLNNNEELFLDFYYHYMNIQYNGLKVMEIYKYILSLNLSDDNQNLPYINSKIMDDFNHYIMKITSTPFMKNSKIDDNYIDLIIKLINDYDFFFKYNDSAVLNKLTDRLRFIRDYTSCMMIILNKEFFNLSKENIMLMINYIKNNEYLRNVIDSGLGKNILDKDYIFEYCSRYLFTQEFVNYDSYVDDLLLKSLKSGKVKDEQLVKNIIKKTDIDFLIKVFDSNFSNFVDMLDNISDDKLFKITIINQLINKIEFDDYIFLLDFIIDNRKVNDYLTIEQIDNIITKIINDYPPNLTDKQVLFLLSYKSDEIFKINVKENLKNNNFSDETRKLLVDATIDINSEDVSFEQAIIILDKIFKNEKIDSITCFLALKALIREFLQDNNIKIYLTKNTDCNGSFDDTDDSIRLNLDVINELVNSNSYEGNPEILHILDTIFHESKHFLQFKYFSENASDSEYMQYKEELLCQVNNNYYDNNYLGINYEKEARVVGAKTIYNLLSTYFPYLVKCIEYYKNLALEEERKIYGDKEIFELSDKVSINDAIDKLVLICPSIIKKYPLLQREYNLDGSRKVVNFKK